MREEKIILLQGNKFELRGGMELEDNGIGDVIEGEDQRELVLFQWEDDAGLHERPIVPVGAVPQKNALPRDSKRCRSSV